MINSHPLALAKKKSPPLKGSYGRASAETSKQRKATSQLVDLANGYSQGPNSSLVEKSDPTQQTPNSRDVGEDSSLAVVSCEGTIGSYQYAEQEREGAFDRERLRLKLKLDRLLVRLKACIRKIYRPEKPRITPQPSASRSITRKESKYHHQAAIVEESPPGTRLHNQKPVRSKSADTNHGSEQKAFSTSYHFSEKQEEGSGIPGNKERAVQRSSDCQRTGINTTGTTTVPQSSNMETTSTNEADQPELRTTFRMVIHLDNAEIAQRRAALDTGATPNLISHRVVRDLSLEMSQYVGKKIAPLGEMFLPIGTVTFEWHVHNRNVTYKTEFAVLEDRYTTDFDILLGKDTISEIGFYRVNDNIFLSNYAGENRLAPAL